MGYFYISGIYPTVLRLTHYLNITDVEIIFMCGCFEYLQVDWIGVMPTDDMGSVRNCLQKDKFQYREMMT